MTHFHLCCVVCCVNSCVLLMVSSVTLWYRQLQLQQLILNTTNAMELSQVNYWSLDNVDNRSAARPSADFVAIFAQALISQ